MNHVDKKRPSSTLHLSSDTAIYITRSVHTGHAARTNLKLRHESDLAR